MSDKLPTEDIKTPINKQKIRLIFPYSLNQEVKKLGAKWNTEEKYWYFPSLNGNLPDDLKKYKSYIVPIEYDDKEYYKSILPSMKWDKLNKKWLINQEDYDKYLKL